MCVRVCEYNFDMAIDLQRRWFQTLMNWIYGCRIFQSAIKMLLLILQETALTTNEQVNLIQLTI